MTKTTEEFFQSLDESVPAVQVVANWLKGFGLEIEVPEIVKRPSFEERFNFSDHGDIRLIKPTGVLRVEVKHRTLSFTGVHDYPYNTMFIDEAWRIDKAADDLAGYVIVNREMTHVAVIYPTTKGSWEPETVPDSKSSDMRTFYACPKELAKFYKIG